jgi:hypothetical protein
MYYKNRQNKHTVSNNYKIQELFMKVAEKIIMFSIDEILFMST